MNEEDILERLKELRDRLPENVTVEDLVERAMEKEREMHGGARQLIGFCMDVGVWQRFQEAAARKCVPAGLLLEKLLQDFLATEGEDQS